MKCFYNMLHHLKVLLFVIMFSLTVSAGVAQDKPSERADQGAGKGLSSQILLTEQEQAWLDRRNTVRVRVGNVPPYHISTPEPHGISVDYLNLIGKRFGINFTFVTSPVVWKEALDDLTGARNWCDLLATIAKSPEREQKISFTEDYIVSPWVIFTRTDSDFVSRLQDLNGKRVAVERGFIISDRIKAEYPQIKVVLFNTSLDALRSVATGKSDAHVGNLTSSSYLIQNNGINNLKVAAPAPFGTHNQAMGVRKDWPELTTIINKALMAMSDEEENDIRNRWMSIRYEYGVDMKQVLSWVAGLTATFLLVCTVILIWNRRLKKEIAHRKRVEEALAESRVILQAAMDQSPAGIAIADAPDGTLRYVNDAGLLIRGGNRQTIVDGIGIDQYVSSWQLLDLDHRPLNADEVPLTRAIMFGETNSREFIIRRTNDDDRIVLGNAAPIRDKNGKVVAGIVVFTDITDRKRAEEALRKSEESLSITLNSIGDALIATDVAGRITRMNPVAERLTGWPLSAAREMILGEVFRIINATTRNPLADPVSLVLERGEVVGLANHTVLINRDGKEYQIADSAAPIHDHDGKIQGVILVFSDVTERYKAAEKIQASLREKETMLKEIHHRVKNNLQVISSLLGLQSGYIMDEGSRKIFQESQDRVRIMAQIHTMLYQSTDLARVDFGGFIRDLASRLQQSYRPAGSPIEIHTDITDVSLTIETSIPCGLILNELVSNALKYAFPGGSGGRIDIGIKCEEGQCTLKIQDNGIGFPESIDFRNTQSLGLELVNLMVGQMDGSIDMQVDGGTMWTIAFPIKNDREWRNG
jgi:PAS domain S-box-containing protein